MGQEQQPTRPTSTKIVDRLPLWAIILLSIGGYFLLLFQFPLYSNFDHVPLLDVRAFTPSLPTGIGYGFLFLFLFGLFILAYRQVSRVSRSIGLIPILGVLILFSLPLLFVYPINANDIYRYVIRGRVASIYGDNPFAVAPDEYPDDPFITFAGEWAEETSPYGPIWELAASIVTSLTGNNLLLGLLAFKILILLTFMATTVVLWILIRVLSMEDAETDQENLVKQPAFTILWAWNPALLLVFIVDGHNDILMIFWLMMGLLLIKKAYPALGFLIMILGALAKPIGILALPLFLVSLLRDKRSISDKLLFLLVVTAGGLLLILLFFIPFGSPFELVQRLMREAGAGGGFSSAALALLLGQKTGIQFSTGSFARFGSVLMLAFVLFVLWLLWRTWRGRSPIRGTADIFFGYLFQALNFRIWYAAWPFTWLILDAVEYARSYRSRYRLHFGLWFLVTTQLSVLIYGHIRIFLLEGSQFLAHLIGVTFTFFLPFLGAKLTAGVSQKPAEKTSD